MSLPQRVVAAAVSMHTKCVRCVFRYDHAEVFLFRDYISIADIVIEFECRPYAYTSSDIFWQRVCKHPCKESSRPCERGVLIDPLPRAILIRALLFALHSSNYTTSMNYISVALRT